MASEGTSWMRISRETSFTGQSLGARAREQLQIKRTNYSKIGQISKLRCELAGGRARALPALTYIGRALVYQIWIMPFCLYGRFLGVISMCALYMCEYINKMLINHGHFPISWTSFNLVFRLHYHSFIQSNWRWQLFLSAKWVRFIYRPLPCDCERITNCCIPAQARCHDVPFVFPLSLNTHTHRRPHFCGPFLSALAIARHCLPAFARHGRLPIGEFSN